MFSNHRKESPIRRPFQKFDIDEERRVKVKLEEMVTLENPRNKSQEPHTKDICKELKEYKKRDFLDHKRRQQLRADSNELRLLQAQLQSALSFKQLTEQNDSLRKQREEDICRKREEDAQRIAEWEKSKQDLIQQEEKERLKKTNFRVDLQGQMHEIQDKRKREFENVIKDSEEMQKIIEQTEKEQKEKGEAERQYRNRYRKEMEECMRNREIQRQLEKEKDADHNERLIKYQRQMDQLKDRMESDKKRLIAEKEKRKERIGNELAEVNKEKAKREELLLLLLEEERKAKEDERYRETLESQVKEKHQLQMEIEKYRKELQIQKERQFREEERQIREEHLRQMAERDKLEQLSDEKRRRKVMEHSKALREMIEIRRRKRAEDIAERIGEFEKILSDEKQRNQYIDEERIRMLQATPGELLRYLPQGVLKPSDREFLSLPENNE